MTSRMQDGVNVAVCPYGDRTIDCDGGRSLRVQ